MNKILEEILNLTNDGNVITFKQRSPAIIEVIVSNDGVSYKEKTEFTMEFFHQVEPEFLSDYLAGSIHSLNKKINNRKYA